MSSKIFWGWAVWLLVILVLVITEIVHLIRQPRTFSWLALFVFLVTFGMGALFLYRGEPPWLIVGTWGVAVLSYYGIKTYQRD